MLPGPTELVVIAILLAITVGPLLATLALFVVCWLPLNILNLGEDLNMPLKNWRYSYTVLQYTI